MSAFLQVRGLIKQYQAPAESLAEAPSSEEASVTILDIPEFSLGVGEFVGLQGRSGCGKTTFLHCLAGLILPEQGTIEMGGIVINHLGESARDRWRARHLGYIPQTFHLLQGLTAIENVLLGMSFGGLHPHRGKALEILGEVGLSRHARHYPRQLSVGQQQRVAVARALVAAPQLVLADEPTGSLDLRHAEAAMDLIQRLCRERGAALLLVSHQTEILARLPQVREFAHLNRAFPH